MTIDSSQQPIEEKIVKVSLLDYGAGNIRSVRNAILAANDHPSATVTTTKDDGSVCIQQTRYVIEDITTPEQIEQATMIVFPGVGSYGSAMTILHEKKFVEPLKKYLQNHDKPFLGICLGMQTLFESSNEFTSGTNGCSDENNNSSSIPGLGIVPGHVIKFDETQMAVPHIGWNGRFVHQPSSPVFQYVKDEELVYYVHSFYAPIVPGSNDDWILTSTTYGSQRFISSIQKGCVVATQFHPEKSGTTGLNILRGFLEAATNGTLHTSTPLKEPTSDLQQENTTRTQLTKRIVVALDVRSNDHGDLVVTKGDQYDVREDIVEDETTTSTTKRPVRNLGKPVALATRYYHEGADEIAFLNITSFRQGVMDDMPMLHVLEEASKNIFVPLTVGGGIRSYTDPVSQQTWSALEVAARYFRAGADKISLGSDAVHAAEEVVANNGTKSGMSSIEMISHVYGAQAVVISIDPKRVYLPTPGENNETGTVVDDLNPNHVVVQLDPDQLGPNGESYCWYQCTVKGGREARDICAVTVCKICEQLGAGEIMLNCIDMDGQGRGYDLALMRVVSEAVTIPVIASSGAGVPDHFVDVFQKTNVQAALAAGMFHRKEVEISTVKEHMIQNGISARMSGFV